VVQPVPVRQDEEARLKEILAWLAQHKMLILTAALAGGLLMGVYAFVKRPVYRAETILSVVEQTDKRGLASAISGRLGDLGGLMGGLGSLGHGNRSEFIALLRSRAFTEQFITDENLIPILFERRAWNPFGRNGPPPTLFRASRLFDKTVREVTESRATGLVTLAIEWRDPVLAARWANLMVARVNELARQRAITEARKSLDYLNQQLATTSIVEVRSVIYQLMESQLHDITLATVREEYAFRIVDPARPPDRDFYVRPKRPLLIVLGLLVGATIGILIELLRGALARS
jgi:uncharacterized protein involved in exopolysaccharide biosynthesis